MNSLHHLVSSVRSSNCQNLRMNALNQVATIGILSGSQATSDDHLTIFSQGFTNGRETFFYSGINKATGIDNYKISV